MILTFSVIMMAAASPARPRPVLWFDPSPVRSSVQRVASVVGVDFLPASLARLFFLRLLPFSHSLTRHLVSPCGHVVVVTTTVRQSQIVLVVDGFGVGVRHRQGKSIDFFHTRC